MTPQDLIRAAAKIIETEGWCSGTDNKGKIVHVRDQSGIPLPLYRGDNTGQDKAKVNMGARSFSIYGALCKALHDARGAVADPGGMWTVMHKMATTEVQQRSGGGNYVHAVIAINEREGQTKDGVLAFLERCAVEFEGEPDTSDIPEAGMVWFDKAAYVDPAVKTTLSVGVAEPEPKIDPNRGRSWSEPALDASVVEITGQIVPVVIGPAPVKAPVPAPKAEPSVEAAKATLPPINWGES